MTKQQLNRWERTIRAIGDQQDAAITNELAEAYAEALNNLRDRLEEFVEDYETLNFSQRMEGDRLTSVAQMTQQAFTDANRKADQAIHRHKAKQLEAGYYGGWWALEGANNISVGLPILPASFVEELVYNEVDGLRLSDRLYKNTRKVASVATHELVQGILAGEGYDYIAAKISEHSEATYKQAVRIARTEGHQTQNAAKQKEYQESKNLGIDIKKMWLATLDKRTRDSHRSMDGQTRELEEPFTLPGGYEAEAPGLSGIAREDINCRCTTVQIIDDIPPELRRDNEGGGIIPFETYEEWAQRKGILKPEELLSEREGRSIDIDTEAIAQQAKEDTIEALEKHYRNLSDGGLGLAEVTDFENVEVNLSLREINSVGYYTSSDEHEAINGLLRGTPESEYPEEFLTMYKEHIANASAAIQKSVVKEDIITYRRIENARFMKLDPENGKTVFVEKGFLSTTPYKDSNYIELPAPRGIVMEIEVPAGTNGLDARKYSEYPEEKELLMPPGTALEYLDERDPIDGELSAKKIMRFRIIPEEELEG